MNCLDILAADPLLELRGQDIDATGEDLSVSQPMAESGKWLYVTMGKMRKSFND